MCSSSSHHPTEAMTARTARRQNIRIAIGLFIYVVTGILQPIIIDYLRLNNLLGRKLLLLPTLANVTGMSLCGLLAKKTRWVAFWSLLWNKNNYNHNQHVSHGFEDANAKRLKKMILVTALVDLLSGMLLTLGMLLTGGAIFVILYNSCPAWTALLSRYILNKKLNAYQMGGVLMVSVGLCMNILGSRAQARSHQSESESESESESSNQDQAHGRSWGVMAGCAFVLVGSFLHSLMFVLSDLSMNMKYGSTCSDDNSEEVTLVKRMEDDKFLADEQQANGKSKKKNTAANNDKNPVISGEIWSCCLGSIETCFMVAWVILGVCMYGFDDDERNNTKAEQFSIHDRTYKSAMMGFVGLIVIDAIHAATFFSLLQNIGAVASALLKGVQAVVVVGLAAVLYCPREEAECLTWMKSASALVVVTGVLGYGFGSKM